MDLMHGATSWAKTTHLATPCGGAIPTPGLRDVCGSAAPFYAPHDEAWSEASTEDPTHNIGGDSPDTAKWPEGITTVMIRNIPLRFTKEKMYKEFDDLSLGEAVVGMHLPMNARRRYTINLGYVFVIFRSPDAALQCRQVFNGRRIGDGARRKPCAVLAARMQNGI